MQSHSSHTPQLADAGGLLRRAVVAQRPPMAEETQRRACRVGALPFRVALEHQPATSQPPSILLDMPRKQLLTLIHAAQKIGPKNRPGRLGWPYT
jgi:hypothetical protein